MYDNKAKVFSNFGNKHYTELFPGADVYFEKDILLACNSFRVLVPTKAQVEKELNIFEITVLRLLEIRFFTNDELAHKMGAEQDFVNFIVASLKERQYLTEDSQLTTLSKQLLGNVDDSEAKVEYRAIRIFSLKNTQQLLPIICFDEKEIVTGFVNRDKKVVEITLGENAGDEQIRTLKYYNSGKRTLIKPTNTEVLRLLKNYMKIQSYSAEKIVINSRQFTIEFVGSVFVHLKAALQSNHLETHIISDGLLNNNSLLVSYFENEENGIFFDNLIESANRKQENDKNQGKFLNQKYNAIIRLMSNAVPFNGETYDERIKAADHNLNAVRRMYSALEWAAHFSLQRDPLSEVLCNRYITGSRNENKRLTIAFAKKAGFRIPKEGEFKNWNILNFADRIKLRDYLKGLDINPNMDILLHLCIAKAASNPANTWNNLCGVMPEILGEKYKQKKEEIEATANDANLESKTPGNDDTDQKENVKPIKKDYPFDFFRIRQLAKPSRHYNDNEKLHITYDKACCWYEKVEKIIKILLPDYASECKAVHDPTTDLTNQNISAIASLKPYFSYNKFRQMPKQIQREVLNVAPSKDEDILFSEMELVLSLCKILEGLLKEEIYLMDIPINKRKSHTDAITHIQMRLEGKLMPPFISTVQERFYNAAVKGEDATLGAYALVWAGHDNVDGHTGDFLADLLATVGELTKLRGHGNKIALSVDKTRLKELRNKVLDIINIMEE
ncbi:hypothetical protein [Phascolarctobacterium succinatutens]|uniref:hypothetical protein n=1 Tax=Phascolarctobacterium succinatutens TaxID=626940 RepID=UPI0023F80C9A|nr:hypothetical protein [Phascolarctobacterium succinatutens]